MAGTSNQTALTTLAVLADTLYAIPFIVGDGGVLDTIAFEVTTFDAGDNARVGIYTNSNDNAPYPASLVLDSGNLSVGANAVVSLAGQAKSLPPGLYWAAFVCSAIPTVRAIAVGGLSHVSGLKSDLTRVSGMTAAFAFAALPASFPAGAAALAAQSLPAVAFHLSS